MQVSPASAKSSQNSHWHLREASPPEENSGVNSSDYSSWGKNNSMSHLILAFSLAGMAAAEMPLHRTAAILMWHEKAPQQPQKRACTKCQPHQNNRECKSCRGASQTGVPWPLELQAQALNRIEIINLIVEEHFARYPVHPATICSTERNVIIFCCFWKYHSIFLALA